MATTTITLSGSLSIAANAAWGSVIGTFNDLVARISQWMQ